MVHRTAMDHNASFYVEIVEKHKVDSKGSCGVSEGRAS
jgi:hypothetical protein